ncbi:hypothetical protein ACVBEH_03065 [Roseateles sp. GG27B]
MTKFCLITPVMTSRLGTWRRTIQILGADASRLCTRLKIFDYGRSKQGTGSYAFKKNWGFSDAASL